MIVRKLDGRLVARLKRRAASHGRSTEAEHREILRSVLTPGKGAASLKEHLLAMPDVGEDRDFTRVQDRGRRVRL